MKRVIVSLCMVVGCDVSQSQTPEPAESDPVAEAAPAPPPRVQEAAQVQPDVSPPEPAPERTPLAVVDVSPSGGPLKPQLRLHAQRGAKKGQRVVLEMGAPWCPPCKRAKALLAEDGFKAELDGVVVLRVNSDDWGEDLDALGFDAPVIPVYYRLAGDGSPSGDSVRGDRWKSRQQVREGLLAFLRG
ncbi:MAG: TlpA family protein disulfide reductase [Nannocystaceae bacterium]|nr:thioredoxin family protein [bacterium]